MRIERIQTRFDVTVQFVQFPLHPQTPVEGQALEALFNCGAEEIAQKNKHMKGLMDAEGLPYGQRTHTYNSRKAQELAKWAETQPEGEMIHNALFKAYFVDCQNVAETDVLLAVCESIGLDVAGAFHALASGSYKEAVDSDWSKSRSYGVTGVPTYVVAQKGVVGAQPYEAIAGLLHEAGVIEKT